MTNLSGLALRDWFAGQALGGLLSSGRYLSPSTEEPFDQLVARVTDTAYRIAESMVRQSERLSRQTNAACEGRSLHDLS